MSITANVIGASGLVGKQLVLLLLENEKIEKVRLFVRREFEMEHPKLETLVVDFRNSESWEKHLEGDVLFSALGTTLKQAGSKEAEYEVDFTFNLNFAQKAKNNGIENYVLVSSIGASHKSKIFYTRMKGELDNAVSEIGFENLNILRPSSLLGNRNEKRVAELLSIPFAIFITTFIFKKYRPIKAEIVAKAMVNAVLKPSLQKTIWENYEIFTLAEIN